LLLPPGLNTPDVLRPDMGTNAVRPAGERVLRRHKLSVGLTSLLLGMARISPPALMARLSLYPALASQKLFDFLCAVRAFRSAQAEGPIARDEWLPHWGSSLWRSSMLLQSVVPQRWSCRSAELARAAASHRWSLHLANEIGFICFTNLGRA
jgi:hypothetical protein